MARSSDGPVETAGKQDANTAEGLAGAPVDREPAAGDSVEARTSGDDLAGPATTPVADPHLESVRTILFAREQARIEALEARAAALRDEGTAREAELQGQIEALQAEVERLNEQLGSPALFPRLISNLSGLVSGAVQSSRQAMAEALGPVMGEAIESQIRDSQDEMVEALYPVILRTVQRAISEFARELQRNIDSRMRNTFQLSGAFRSLTARVRGVSCVNSCFKILNAVFQGRLISVSDTRTPATRSRCTVNKSIFRLPTSASTAITPYRMK